MKRAPVALSFVLSLSCSEPARVASLPPATPHPLTEPASGATPVVPPRVAARADASVIARKVLFGNPDRLSPQLSPNGKQMLFVAPDEGMLNVWVAPADDPKSAKVVTHERKRPIYSALWAQTGDKIVYVNDRGGDENFHLFAVDLKSGDEKDLTPFDGVRVEIVDTYETHPTLVFARMNKRDKKFMDPVLVDVKTGAIQVLDENTQGYVRYLADRDAKLRFAFKLNPDGTTDMLVPAKKGEWKTYATIPAEDADVTYPLFFEQNNRVVYLEDSRGRDTTALVSLDVAKGQSTVLFGDPSSDVDRLMVDPRQHQVQAVATNRERLAWHVLDKAIQGDIDALGKVNDGELDVASRSRDDKRWVVAYRHDDAPTAFYLWDRDKKKATFLFSNRKALEDAKLTKMRPVTIKARDGLELVSYLSLPRGSDGATAGRPDKPLPMVLSVHGGPWGRDVWGFDPTHQWLASRGYAVLSVNFRASRGFGKKFLNAGDREWAGKMHDDLLDAVKWAIDEKIAMPDKIAIMGGSYGGYATLVGLTFTPDVFACGVDIVGPSNLVTLLSSIPPYWTARLEKFARQVGDPRTDEGKKLLLERSPLSRVAALKKPLLIGQGANDPRVKQVESDQIVKAMQAKGLPVTYVLYPDEGHGFARPENRLSFFAVAEIFLAEQLGGVYQPIGDDLANSSITVPSGVEQIEGLSTALGAGSSR